MLSDLRQLVALRPDRTPWSQLGEMNRLYRAFQNELPGYRALCWATDRMLRARQGSIEDEPELEKWPWLWQVAYKALGVVMVQMQETAWRYPSRYERTGDRSFHAGWRANRSR